jgi:cysteine synthase B
VGPVNAPHPNPSPLKMGEGSEWHLDGAGSYPVLNMTKGPVDAGITQLIGNTPLLKIRLFEKDFPRVEVYAKAEWFNPGGSVKDRAALAMIVDGEKRGALTRDKTIIDSTSGNTGIAYALVGAAKGYRVKLVMPGNVSAERKALVVAYGAEILYSDPLEGSDGAILKVREVVAKDPDAYFYPDQYSNPANWRAHYEGTAVEILEQTSGRLTHFVAGLGTTGTFVGSSRRLKEHDASIRTIAVEPEDSFHGLEGLKHLPTAIVPKIWDPSVADEIWGCPTEPAYDMARSVARSEGLLVGHSSGAALWAVRRVAESIREGVVVTVFPDSGDRYLSTGLYGSKPK